MKDPRQPKAAAIRYDANKDRAPKVVAAGRGELARKIIETALECKVPVYENPDLVEILSQLEQFQQIPPACYRVVAEILHFVYRLNEQYKEEIAGA